MEDRPGHDRRYALNPSRIRSELGWRPERSFEEGLEHTVRWYMKNPRWVERVTSGGYRRQRLGLLSDQAGTSSDGEATRGAP